MIRVRRGLWPSPAEYHLAAHQLRAPHSNAGSRWFIVPRVAAIREPMDVIFISQLRVETVIGIYDWEREIKQRLVIDLEMAGDCETAAATDALESTVDYKAVCKRIIRFAQESEFQLVESFAHRLAELTMSEFSIPWLRLRVDKVGALRGAQGVGVVIERGRRG